MEQEIIQKINQMRKLLNFSQKTESIKSSKKQSLEQLLKEYEYLKLCIRNKNLNSSNYELSSATLKKIEEEKKKRLNEIYKSENYKMLKQILMSTLEIKLDQERKFLILLKQVITNEEDFERLLALSFYYRWLQGMEIILTNIKWTFPSIHDFRNYLTQFPVEKWENCGDNERQISFQRILANYFDLTNDETKREE